eukprot:g3494.t1
MSDTDVLLEDRLVALEAQAGQLANAADLDTAWIIWCGILVFFMQVGFSMLEVGSISPKNTKAVLIKNLTDAALGAICWWTLGHGFAYGADAGGFIGTDSFAFSAETVTDEQKGFAIAQWFFQWAFAATAATVVSGAVAERIKIVAYVQFSVLIIFFIYPLVVHWAWSTGGWASPHRCENTSTAEEYQLCREESRALLLGCGVSDFAGAGVVHMTGGICALVGAKMLGPRTGRFRPNGTLGRMSQQSPALQTLGALILWVGWYGFNGGSVGSVAGGRTALVGSAVVNTTIAAAACVICTGLWLKAIYKKFDSSHLNNGILSGLVAISATGPLVEPEGAFIVGVVGSGFYLLGVEGLKWFRIDDVVQASAVHFMCGVWGVISAALLTTKERYRDVYSYDIFSDPGREDECCGLLYGCSGRLFGANLIFIVVITAWVAGMSFLALSVIRYFVGLRVPMDVEEMGMDKSRHPRNKSSTALRRALRSAAGKDDRSSTASSHRPSFKSSHTGSPRNFASRTTLAHWKD